MDAELEFAIQPNTTGKQLFDQVSFNHMKYAAFDNVEWNMLQLLCMFFCDFTGIAAMWHLKFFTVPIQDIWHSGTDTVVSHSCI